ncbi:pyruvate kinase [Haematococcus lacustris]
MPGLATLQEPGRGHKPVQLYAGQLVTVVAVGDAYDSWEGGLDTASGVVRIGLSYQHLCSDAQEGGRILIGDGSITLEVMAIKSATELQAKVLNSYLLGERKNCNLPGVRVRLPVLTAHDVEDVQQFACKNHSHLLSLHIGSSVVLRPTAAYCGLGGVEYEMDFVAASFVQSAEDVR